MPYQPIPEININNLNDYSIEEVIQEAVYRLLQQNRYSYDPASGECLYRSDDGARCAVGLLIPDDTYRSDFEEEGAARVLDYLGYDINCKDHLLTSCLMVLQGIHDDMARDRIELTLDNMIAFYESTRHPSRPEVNALIYSALHALKRAESSAGA